jgi:hypothetical protein
MFQRKHSTVHDGKEVTQVPVCAGDVHLSGENTKRHKEQRNPFNP